MPDKHHHHHHSSHRSLNGKNFIILPVVFSIVILGIAALIAIPTVTRFYNIASLFFSDVKFDYSDNYRNIYVPTTEGLEEPEESSEVKAEPKKPLNAKTVPITTIEMPRYSDQFGELIIEDCGIKVPLFFGDGNAQLNNGVGIYAGSGIPGYGRPIMVAGHNVTYFNGLKYAKEGQIVLIRTSYGNYRYEITGVEVHDKDDASAYDLEAEEETLTMYTCYPFDMIGLTPNRCFVYAKFLSGPVLDKYN